jgi:hypothetical protein
MILRIVVAYVVMQRCTEYWHLSYGAAFELHIVKVQKTFQVINGNVPHVARKICTPAFTLGFIPTLEARWRGSLDTGIF